LVPTALRATANEFPAPSCRLIAAINVHPVCDAPSEASHVYGKASKAKMIVSFFEHLKTEASAEWRAYTEHPFTDALADGSLAEAAFRHYLAQDYLFLIEFARAYALSVYKSPKLADMREGAAGLSAILDVEMNLHVKLCAG
jgi:thiaminase (transcriptional activator TenA)